jgi:ribosomal protein S18 acetylase RimI-like enzyme
VEGYRGSSSAFALIVEAKDENAVAFYQHHGFRRFASKPASLFLPLGTAKKGAAE